MNFYIESYRQMTKPVRVIVKVLFIISACIICYIAGIVELIKFIWHFSEYSHLVIVGVGAYLGVSSLKWYADYAEQMKKRAEERARKYASISRKYKSRYEQTIMVFAVSCIVLVSWFVIWSGAYDKANDFVQDFKFRYKENFLFEQSKTDDKDSEETQTETLQDINDYKFLYEEQVKFANVLKRENAQLISDNNKLNIEKNELNKEKNELLVQIADLTKFQNNGVWITAN